MSCPAALLAPAEEQEDDAAMALSEEDLGHRKKLREPSSIIFSFGSKPEQLVQNIYMISEGLQLVGRMAA
jgi:hypothetical protein